VAVLVALTRVILECPTVSDEGGVAGVCDFAPGSVELRQ